MKVLLEIAYVGTAYSGFQAQKNAPSIQKTVQDALEEFFDTEIALSGCSRTDAGVHAKQFFATAEGNIPESFPIERLPRITASILPPDIVIVSASFVPDSFHVRYDVQYKEYEYLVLNTELSDPFMKERAYHYPRHLDEKLMHRAAQHFVGTHDFKGFMAVGSKVKSTVRTIRYFTVERHGAIISMRVAGDGFLYNMVRILCGTLIAVSEGRIPEESLDALIASGDRKKAGATLPPDGLYLAKVAY